MYYLCVHGKPELKECPKKTVWDTDKLICNWPVDVTRPECRSVVFAALEAAEDTGPTVGKQDDQGVNIKGPTKEPVKESSSEKLNNNSIELKNNNNDENSGSGGKEASA